LQKIVAHAEDQKFKLDVSEREFDEMIKITEQSSTKRTTIGEKDLLLAKIDRMTENIGDSSSESQ
jgi:hypothetical protein